MDTLISSKKVYDGAILRLLRQKRRLPNGRVKTFEVIEHPGAVLVLPVFRDGRVVLIRQYRAAIDTYLYELCAGTLNQGEDPAACAKRELLEETGYQARTMKKIGAIYPAPGYTTEKIHLYMAGGLLQRGALVEDDEIIETCIVTRAQIRKLLKGRLIVDAKTISALVLGGII